MPSRLKRFYGLGHWHFINCTCYRRRKLLAPPERMERFLVELERVRVQFRFHVGGYVVMPEHFHMLISEPELGDPSGVMQLLKQRTAHVFNKQRRAALHAFRVAHPEAEPKGGAEVEDVGPFWQVRFVDFNVYTHRKRIEKIRYMHNNPVKRELVREPGEWRWSSFRFYRFGEEQVVKISWE